MLPIASAGETLGRRLYGIGEEIAFGRQKKKDDKLAAIERQKAMALERLRYQGNLEREDSRFDAQMQMRNQDRAQDTQLKIAEMIAGGWRPNQMGDITDQLGTVQPMDAAPTVNLGGQELRYSPPPPKPDFDIRDTEQGVVRIDKNTGTAQQVMMGRQALTPRPQQAPMQTFQLAPQSATGGAPMSFNPRTNQMTPVLGPDGRPMAAQAPKLPAEAQTQKVAFNAASAALDNFEALSKNYLSKGALSRAVGQARGSEDVGQLEAAQQAVMLNLKELAKLGVLAGPDMDIMTKMIGDPASTGALIRDPKGTLARIGEARKFINDRVRAIDSTYGGQEPPPVRPPTSNPYR